MERNLKTEQYPSELFQRNNPHFISFVRKCEVCGDNFRMRTWNHKYCSAECRKLLTFTSESRICPACGGSFMSKRYNQKYCNAGCKKEMALRRYNEKRRENGKAN